MVVVGIGMNGGLVRQVALEWHGKGQGTQWPNMDVDEVEVEVDEKNLVLDQGGRRVQVKVPQLTVHNSQCTCTRTCSCTAHADSRNRGLVHFTPLYLTSSANLMY